MPSDLNGTDMPSVEPTATTFCRASNFLSQLIGHSGHSVLGLCRSAIPRKAATQSVPLVTRLNCMHTISSISIFDFPHAPQNP